MFTRLVRKFLNIQFISKPSVLTVPKQPFHFVFPYFGPQSDKLKRYLLSVLNKYYTYLDFKLITNNKFTIGYLFNFKDKLPKSIRSSIVYMYSCAQCECASYVGSTKRNFRSRYVGHVGISTRTGLPLSSPDSYIVRDHSFQCGDGLSFDNFQILDSVNDPSDLRIFESLYIYINLVLP